MSTVTFKSTNLNFLFYSILKADEYDSRQNEVVKNEELTYNNHSSRLQSHYIIAALAALSVIIWRNGRDT